MSLTKKKKQLLTRLSTIGTTMSLLAIKGSISFAESIGTAEVETATENIKRVITSIAMPLRWCSNFCKCRCSSHKNDSQC